MTATLPDLQLGKLARLRVLRDQGRVLLRDKVPRLFRKHAQPVLKNLASIPLTVAGIAAIDFGAFHYIHMIGWIVTGVSLFYLEHLIADET